MNNELNRNYPYLGMTDDGSIVWFMAPDEGRVIKYNGGLGFWEFSPYWHESEFKRVSIKLIINKLLKRGGK